MSYTVATVTTRVQNLLDNPAFSAAKILQFMNDYQREVARKYKLSVWQDTEEVTSSESNDNLTGLPTDLLIPISLRMTDPYDFLVPYVEYQDIDEHYPDPSSDGTAQTQIWYSYGGALKIYPYAGQVYTFKLRYARIPTELSGQNDTPELPEISSECLVLGCQVRALKHDDQNTKAQLIQQDLNKLELELFQPSKSGGFIMPLPNKRRRITRIR